MKACAAAVSFACDLLSLLNSSLSQLEKLSSLLLFLAGPYNVGWLETEDLSDAVGI